MPTNHLCTDNCWKNRTSDKYKLKCVLCDANFNSKCFGIKELSIVASIQSNKYVSFICDKCLDKTSKSKLSRRSNCKQITTPSSGSKSNSILCTDKRYQNKAAPDDVSTQSFISIDESSVTNVCTNNGISNNKDETIDLKLSKLFEKLNSLESLVGNISNNSTATAANVSIDNIFKLVLKIDDKINKLHNIDNEKSSLQQIFSRIDSKNLNQTPVHPRTLSIRDATFNHSVSNWSMQNDSIEEIPDVFAGRPSVLIKQTIDDDIVEILKNSDKITWETLDFLTKEIKLQNEKLDTLIQSKYDKSISPMESPLVQSVLDSNISMDNSNSTPNLILQQTNENYVDIFAPMSAQDHQPTTSQITLESTGNFVDVNKPKEAMTHNFENVIKVVPESLKPNVKQKRLMPNSPVGKPGMHSVNHATNEISSSEAQFGHVSRGETSNFSNHLDQTDVFSNTMLDNEIITTPINILNFNATSETISNLVNNQAASLDTENSSVDSDSSVLSNTSISFMVEHIHDISGDHIAGKSDETASGNANTSKFSEVLHELYLSNVPTDITETDIIEYIDAKGISNTNDIKVTKLVKPNTDLSLLTFISYKIDTVDSIAHILSDQRFWPNKCVIKKFVQKTKKQNIISNSKTASSQNFRITRRESDRQT